MTARELVASALGLVAGILVNLVFGQEPCRRACCVGHAKDCKCSPCATMRKWKSGLKVAGLGITSEEVIGRSVVPITTHIELRDGAKCQLAPNGDDGWDSDVHTFPLHALTGQRCQCGAVTLPKPWRESAS